MSYTIYVIIFILLNDIIQSNNISNLNMKSNLKLSLKGNQLINESNSYIFKKENQEKSIIGKIKKIKMNIYYLKNQRVLVINVYQLIVIKIKIQMQSVLKMD